MQSSLKFDKNARLNSQLDKTDENKETILEENKNNIEKSEEDNIPNELEENDLEEGSNITENNTISNENNSSHTNSAGNSATQEKQPQVQPEIHEPEPEKPTVNTPLIPEPAYGTVIIGGIQPGIDNGWAYLGIVVQDIWVGYEESSDGWARSIRQSTLGTNGQGIDGGEAFDIAERQYPLRTDIGVEGQVIEYERIWVYCGAGRY